MVDVDHGGPGVRLAYGSAARRRPAPRRLIRFRLPAVSDGASLFLTASDGFCSRNNHMDTGSIGVSADPYPDSQALPPNQLGYASTSYPSAAKTISLSG